MCILQDLLWKIRCFLKLLWTIHMNLFTLSMYLHRKQEALLTVRIINSTRGTFDKISTMIEFPGSTAFVDQSQKVFVLRYYETTVMYKFLYCDLYYETTLWCILFYCNLSFIKLLKSLLIYRFSCICVVSKNL